MSNKQNSNDGNEGLNSSLVDAPETKAVVSERLHQDIMRAVRLSQPEPAKPQFQRWMPVWATGLAATAAVVVYLAQPPAAEFTPQQVSIPEPPASGASLAVFAALEEKLATLPQESGIAEQQLLEEMERLKSDLKQFGIGS